jgi:heavy metal sensor kinase
MSLNPLKNFMKTVGFRLTVWYSGIFILSAFILFGIAYFVLSSSLKRRDQQAIQVKLKELSVLYQTGGMEFLEREITIEQKFEKRSPFFIRLAGEMNRTLYLKIPYQWTEFNLKALENKLPGENWIRLPAAHSKTKLEVASVRLSDNYLLQVGQSTEDRENILRHFREIFVFVTIPLMIIGFTGGIFLAFRALQPIRELIAAIRSIDTGKMDARVPSPQTGDEFDELSMLFNGMVEKIEMLINSMRESLDNVAHDLRTPMTRLRGIAEMALRSNHSSAEYKEALADCMEESERILMMLNALMDISEAETGVMKLDRKAVDISALIDEILDMYRYVAEEKDIALHVDAPDGIFTLADPVRMRQVLGNLLDNAIKYTPCGGRIDIKTRRDSQVILIIIQDAGAGIFPEALPRIWDRLYRSDQSRSQRGLGLGLSLVKAIVEAHNGRVEVVSHPGTGTTFTVSLPTLDSIPS